MSILNENIIFNDTPFFKKSFALDGKTGNEFLACSDALLEEIKATVANEPFFSGKNSERLSDFISLASACADFAMLEGAEFSIYTDNHNSVIIYAIAPCFYLRRAAMISLSKICLLALDVAISTPDNAEECVISFGFDFLQN